MAFAVGQTAIIVPVGAAEPIVGRWRTRFDPAAAVGVRAHVTIIYPFLPESDIDEAVVGEVHRLVAPATCAVHRGPRGFTNLMVSIRDQTIVRGRSPPMTPPSC